MGNAGRQRIVMLTLRSEKGLCHYVYQWEIQRATLGARWRTGFRVLGLGYYAENDTAVPFDFVGSGSPRVAP